MVFRVHTKYDPISKIWRGPDFKPAYNPDISIGQAVLHMLNLCPNKVVQIHDKTGQKLTASQMRLLTIRAAQNLQRMGYDDNDVIGIISSNVHFLAPLVFGAFLNGTPISTLDPSFDKGEIKHMLSITRPKLIFCNGQAYEVVKQAVDELNLRSLIYLMNGSVKGVPGVEEIFEETKEESSFIPQKLRQGGDQIAAILCSSGTTGLPKGVCMTHRGLIYQTESLLTSEDVLLCFSTLYWFSGLYILIIGTLCSGTRIITDEPTSPGLLLRLIEKYKVTMLLMPPSQMAAAVQCPDIKFRDLSSVRYNVCGGSSTPVVVTNEMQSYLKYGKVLISYGMSEITGLATCEFLNRMRLSSVGHLARGIEVKLIDDDGKQLDVNERGEICVKTPFKFLGYYGNVEATKIAQDNEGWIRSGDVGYFDDDGYLFIVDRKKDILKYKNYHYYPTEIEAVIVQIPDVVEVCVFGLPDLVATDLPAAAIVKKHGSSLTKDDVYNYVAENMSDFKHLRGGVYFVKSLPKTASGKVLRRKVQEIITKNCQGIEEFLDN